MEHIHAGMHVLTLDGQHLGKVSSLGAGSFRVRSRQREVEVPEEQVGSVLQHEVFLRLALRRYLEPRRPT